jgi:endonuclease YncB( thermonuclease family)
VVYTVQEGDTPQSIADQYGVDVVLLIAARARPGLTGRQPGDQINLPTQAVDVCRRPTPVESTVAGVTDGDTIDTLIGGQSNTVHYLGIDAPEIDPNPQPFGAEALSFNQSLVDGQVVTLVQDVTPEDSAGQLPRYVLAGDTFVNYEMVRQGYANAVSTPPDTTCDELFALAAEQARIEKLGMWAEPGAQTPGGQTLTPASPVGTATPTAPPVVWVPPPTLTPTSTSSLGFTCHCGQRYDWGNFSSPAQGDVCEAICDIAAARKQAACATAMVGGTTLAGCK